MNRLELIDYLMSSGKIHFPLKVNEDTIIANFRTYPLPSELLKELIDEKLVFSVKEKCTLEFDLQQL